MNNDEDPDATGEFEVTVTDAIRKYARGKMQTEPRRRSDRRKNDKLTFKDWIGLVSVFVLPLGGTFLANHIAIIRLQDSHNVMIERYNEKMAEMKQWNLSLSQRVRDLEKGE